MPRVRLRVLRLQRYVDRPVWGELIQLVRPPQPIQLRGNPIPHDPFSHRCNVRHPLPHALSPHRACVQQLTRAKKTRGLLAPSHGKLATGLRVNDPRVVVPTDPCILLLARSVDLAPQVQLGLEGVLGLLGGNYSRLGGAHGICDHVKQHLAKLAYHHVGGLHFGAPRGCCFRANRRGKHRHRGAGIIVIGATCQLSGPGR